MSEYSLFQQLPIRDQVELLARQGAAIAHRNHKGWSITLYAINNYFVEQWEKDGLAIVGTFKSSAKPVTILEPYLDNLQVQQFLEI
ncbi:hypothetical protein [Adhaeribacter pallidiroseus]|uniref:Uncharacterized protein n=1 Tax=Adhaeribacter pallidiroseus TaxID=2072847 RepID=A0A369QMT3_9BACT|nr:hypothetical protein [Adhaeribacter pallidiroseus]RDC64526.1 hypothetical protein AHMF7616_03140 [Adhaeribacter pallidiroseus]